MRSLLLLAALVLASGTARAEPQAGFETTYSASLVRIYDGDTIWVDIDLGLGISLGNEALRLYGIDTPELRGEEREAGLLARDRLTEILADCPLIIETIEDRRGKYGRLLAVLWCDGVNVNQQLVNEGHAVEY